MRGTRRIFGEQPEYMRDLNIGDMVWVGNYNFPRTDGVGKVLRFTATLAVVQIIGRSSEQKFYLADGYEFGKSYAFQHPKITGRATRGEVLKFKAQMATDAAESEKRVRETNRVDRKRTELNRLFGSDNVTVYHDSKLDGKTDIWRVSLNSLTTDQVASLAGLLNLNLEGK